MTTSSHPTTSAVPDPGIFPVKRPLTKKKLFAYTFLSAVAGFLALFYIDRPSRVVQLSDEVSISSQLKVSDIGRFRLSEFKTIVDIRPDGEAIGQPSSEEMREAAERFNVDFYYIPVPHEGGSESAVTRLADVLATAPKPALLYCRTGRRAVRLFALAEAARIGGPNVDTILRMVVQAGFSAADLKDAIKARITLRTRKPAEK
jgi:uncharacterized protein (TIGR01244 family)